MLHPEHSMGRKTRIVDFMRQPLSRRQAFVTTAMADSPDFIKRPLLRERPFRQSAA